MKKTYEKPMLVKAGTLVTTTATAQANGHGPSYFKGLE